MIFSEPPPCATIRDSVGLSPFADVAVHQPQRLGTPWV